MFQDLTCSTFSIPYASHFFFETYSMADRAAMTVQVLVSTAITSYV